MITNAKLGDEFHLLVNGENPVILHFRNVNLSAAIASNVDSFTGAPAVHLIARDNVAVRSGWKTSLQRLRQIISIVVNGNESFSATAEGNLVGAVVPPIIHLLACNI